MLKLRTTNFKGTLISLLGKLVSEAIKGLTQPEVYRSGIMDMLVWREVGQEDNGQFHDINFVAVVQGGRVVAVALHSRNIISRLHAGSNNVYFAASPSPCTWSINLVTREAKGIRNSGPLQEDWTKFQRVA